MNLYIDESGSINNHLPNNAYFIIALVHVTDIAALRRAYKRFVSANYAELQRLDQDKLHPTSGKIVKSGGKMFSGNKFRELKGTKFDPDMKAGFVRFFSQKPSFEVYYIKIANQKLTDRCCANPARVFNYAVRLALEFFIRNGFLPNENCTLQIDERNEKFENRHFLENYLNTELILNGAADGSFSVAYFDSVSNSLVQIADVFANLYYSHLQTGAYAGEFQRLQDTGILKSVFEFPFYES